MPHKQLLAAMVLALATAPAFAVYKCVDANGRTAFQEFPCEATGSKGGQIEVRPATPAPQAAPAPESTPGTAAAPAATAPAETAAPTEAERLRAKADQLRRENRLSTLKNLEIPGAQARIRGASNRCDERMRAVRSQKALASNNLAGATWEQSLSTEMQAIATQCSVEQTRLIAELNRLLEEQRTLEQAQQQTR